MRTTQHLIAVILLVVASSTSFAHKEPTHQYIVREAYKLLKKLVGPIPDMEAHIGTTEGRTPPNPMSWNKHPFIIESKVVAGAWREDIENPMNGNTDPWNVSTTHFWKADLGDGSASEIDFDGIRIDHDDNSFRKVWRYAIGDWDVAIREIAGDDYTKDYYFRYMGGLTSFYRVGYVWPLKIEAGFNNGRMRLTTKKDHMGPTPFEEFTHWSAEDRRGYAYYILGRMCHLLGDMGLAVHAHMQQHAYPRDIYENGMDVEGSHDWFPKSVSANSVFEDGGGFIDPGIFCSDPWPWNPLHYLMYTTNQYADHYASKNISGNNTIGGDRNIKELTDVGSLLASATGVTNGDYYSNRFYIDPLELDIDYDHLTELDPVRDNLFTYSIRATAGLLYWFAKETGQLAGDACNNDLFIQNSTFIQNPYLFISKNIHIGNNVDASTPFGDVNVLASAKVECRGSVSVSIQDGFHARTNDNGSFWAHIAPCPSPCSTNSGGIVEQPGQNNWADPLASAAVDTIYSNGDADQYLTTTISLIDDSKYYGDLTLSVYPNPANSLININYELDRAGTVTITLFDVLGNVLYTLPGEFTGAGNHSMTYQTTQLPAGTYYIRMEASGKVLTKEVKIIR
jgi:type IX secretion system substrate protein